MLLNIIGQKPKILLNALNAIGAYEHWDWAQGTAGIMKGSTLSGSATIGYETLDNGMTAANFTNEWLYMTDAVDGWLSGVDLTVWCWYANYQRSDAIIQGMLNPADISDTYAAIGTSPTNLSGMFPSGAGVATAVSTYNLESNPSFTNVGAFLSVSYDSSTKTFSFYADGVFIESVVATNSFSFSAAQRFVLSNSLIAPQGDRAHVGFGLNHLTAAQHLSFYNAVVLANS